MQALIGKDDMRELVKQFVEDCGTQREAAKRLGVSDNFLSLILRGKAEVTQRIADQLGFTRDYWFSAKTN